MKKLKKNNNNLGWEFAKFLVTCGLRLHSDTEEKKLVIRPWRGAGTDSNNSDV